MKTVKPATHFSTHMCLLLVFCVPLIFGLKKIHDHQSVSAILLYLVFLCLAPIAGKISELITSKMFSAACNKCYQPMNYSIKADSLYTCERCATVIGYKQLTQSSDSIILDNSSIRLDSFEYHDLITVGERGDNLAVTRIMIAVPTLFVFFVIAQMFDLGNVIDTIKSLFANGNYIMLNIYVAVIIFIGWLFYVFVSRQLREPKPERYRLYKDHLIYKTGRPTISRAANLYTEDCDDDSKSPGFQFLYDDETHKITSEALREMKQTVVDSEYGIYVQKADNENFNLARYSTVEERQWLFDYIRKYYSTND